MPEQLWKIARASKNGKLKSFTMKDFEMGLVLAGHIPPITEEEKQNIAALANYDNSMEPKYTTEDLFAFVGWMSHYYEVGHKYALPQPDDEEQILYTKEEIISMFEQRKEEISNNQ